MKKPVLLLALGLCLALPAQARPIAYPGGWSVMTMNDPYMNTLEAFYTPDPSYSLGWRHDYWRDEEANMDALQFNYLLKRWNNPGSQGNFYLKAGTGAAYGGDDTAAAFYGGMDADWESRRWFVSYGNTFTKAGSIKSDATHTARIGIAPYIGDYGDIHTWLMLQADYWPGREDNFSLTPLVRLFHGAVLGEAGVNLDGGAFFHLMLTF
jgi:hypothetical protein